MSENLPNETHGSGSTPWTAYGLSERTYYRRKAEGTLPPSPPPQQHMAHAIDYVRSLPSMARLDFLSYARRCRIEVGRA